MRPKVFEVAIFEIFMIKSETLPLSYYESYAYLLHRNLLFPQYVHISMT